MTQTPSVYPDGPGVTSAEPPSGALDQAQQKLGQAVDRAQGTAGQVSQQAKQQATLRLESQKGQVVDSLVTVAQALRQTGQHLHEQEQTAVGGYVEQAAERMESVTNYLRVRDVPQLLAETQDFARRRPGLFVGGAVALGFLGARFLMSSGQRAAPEQTSGIGSPYTPSFGQSGFEPSGRGSRTDAATSPPTASGYTAMVAPELSGTNVSRSVAGALDA
jgi:hypothetical protein